MDPSVFPFHSSGKGTPYIIDTGDLPRAEEVFLHESNGIFERLFAFRVSLIAHPEPDIPFRTEAFKDSGLDDLAIGFAGEKHGILINDKFLWPVAKLTEESADCLTGFPRIVFMVLHLHIDA